VLEATLTTGGGAAGAGRAAPEGAGAADPQAGGPRYRPIRDYAAIGDCHGSALVARDGSIDWCCLKRHDAEPVFCRLLDADRGGYWSVAPSAPGRVERRYLDGTNILRTEIATASGRVAVTDFMPVGRRHGAGLHDYVNLVAPHWLVRRLEGLEGTVALEIRYRPSRAFAREPAALLAAGGAVRGEGVPTLISDLPFRIEGGDTARASVEVAAGGAYDLVLAANTVEPERVLDRADEFLAVTTAFWREWIAFCRYDGAHADMVRRSALALKLMTYAPTGALVAALTTSLPETIGGERNWDYRFSWLRDSCFALYALAALGYGGEAKAFVMYLLRCARETLPELQIMYGIGAEHDLAERELDHLAGYRDSRPVRVGNGAHAQRQMDIYGDVLDLASLYVRLGGELDVQHRRLLEALVRIVERRWDEPDQGLWEMRGPPLHHVHGKIMSWVAVDRAIGLFGERSGWRGLRNRMLAAIRERGVDPEGGFLRQAFDRPGLDAATLLAPMLALPVDRRTLEATVDAVEAGLRRGDFLSRYRGGDDGFEGEEGAFLICGFWLVDALLAVGRPHQARARFGRLLASANDVGLYSEEIDPATGEFLGNFPQAFTHLALIGSAVNLDLHASHGPEGVLGCYADRAGRAVGATFGWRAVLATMRQTRRIGRLRSSKESVMLWP
jgi:GH15 family glucan-1,4-alpha-glucosidase